MKNIFSYFIHHYKINLIISLAGLILGFMGLKNLRREARPPVDFARVAIVTSHPGASSLEIEEFITNKIEDNLRSVTGIKKSYSQSLPGLSQITLFLDLDNTDTQQTVDDIYRAVQNVPDLPTDLLERPHVLHVKASEIPILNVAVVGKGAYRHRVAYELKSLLQSLPNIARVDLSGFQNREYQILIHPQKAKAQSVSLSEVVRAVKSHSKDISSGRVRSSIREHSVRFFGKFTHVQDIKNIIIRSNFSGQKIYIKDIADVKDTQEEQTSYFFVKGQPAVSLQIIKKEQADILKTVQHIEEFLRRYSKTLSPDLKLVTVFDESARTKNTLNIVTNNAFMGLILVLLILWFFLPGWLGVVTALSVPLSILCSVALLAGLGITFNIITMCAFIICIGMFVDDAVVISEYYAQMRAKNMAPISSAEQAVTMLWKPVLATTATTVMSFLPMLLTKGVMGEFIQWMPIVVSIALSICLVESFFLLPCRLRLISNKAKSYTHSKPGLGWFKKVKKQFEFFILKALDRKYLSVFAIFLFVLLSLTISFFKNRFILFPTEKVEVYSAIFEMDKKLSDKEMEKRAIALSHQVRTIIGKQHIKHSYSFINSPPGIGLAGGPSTGRGQGTFYVEVQDRPARKWKHTEVLKKLKTLDHSPFKTLRFEALRRGPPVGRPVELILFSQNEEQLNGLAQDVSQTLSSIDGLLNLKDSREYSGPEYSIYPKREVLSALGLSIQEVGTALRTALHGQIITETTDQGETFYVRVLYNSEGRSRIDSLKHIYVQGREGQMASLDKLVHYEEKAKGPEIKKHYMFSPSITFYADVNEQKTSSVLANTQIKKALRPLLKKYPAVSYKQAGEHESTEESVSSLKQAGIFVVFCIFGFLLLMFNSFSLSILILSNVFLGLVGISWAFLLHSKPLSFFALIGTVGLAGVVINSAIILVSFIEKQRKLEPHKPLKNILAKASATRLRPILITTATTVFGLFPTAYGIGGHDTVLIPITLALTWGLISGTILTLIWTPCGYLIIQDLKNWFKTWRRR